MYKENQLYASAESVQDFYYTLTAYFNGADTFLPVSDETDSDSSDGMLDGSLDFDISQIPGSTTWWISCWMFGWAIFYP